MTKQLLFSVTAADCEWDYIRGSGKGGQKRNKTSSAVRCRHLPSGAVGYSEESRSQSQNKKSAFLKMAESKEFKAWHRLEVAKRTGELLAIEEKVEREIHNPNMIKTEVKDEEGRWVEGDASDERSSR